MSDYEVIGVDPDLTQGQFIRILEEAQSPALSAAYAVYAYCVRRGVSPAFVLALFQHESGFGKAGTATITHSWGNTRRPAHGGVTPVRLTVEGEARSGQFPVFRDWIDGGIATAARLVDYAPYQGKTSVREIIPTWAPAADMNDPDGYVRKVLTLIERWTSKEGTVGHVPKPPITRHIYGTPPKVDGVGLDRIGTNRTPGATVLHSMAGTLGSCDNYFPGPSVEALTDFGVGQTNHNGSGFAQIIQWCDIRGRLMPWASGPVRVPQGDGPRFLAHFGGAGAVNNVGVSIEHDDTTLPDGSRAVVATAPVSLYQWSASIWLQAYLHAEEFGQTADTYDWNMHHREFCGDEYKTCPRPRIFDYTEQYQAAVKATMDHYQKGTPYPSGGLVVAGIRINTPPESGTVSPTAPARPPGYLAVGQADTFNWQGAGVIVARSVRYYNPDTKTFYERTWDNTKGFTPWQKVA